jgi:hypothetical protein
MRSYSKARANSQDDAFRQFQNAFDAVTEPRMKTLIKKAFRKFGVELSRYTANPLEHVVSLNSQNETRGNVILSLWIDSFLLKDGKFIPNTHGHIEGSMK